MVKVEFKLKKDPRKALEGLRGSIQKKIKRKAETAASTPVLNMFRAAAPTDSGALKKSLAKKIKGKDYSMYSVYGPRSKFGIQKKGRLKIPNMYFKKADAKHRFTVSTVTRSKSTYVNTISRVYKEEIAKELAKGGK